MSLITGKYQFSVFLDNLFCLKNGVRNLSEIRKKRLRTIYIEMRVVLLGLSACACV